MLEHVGMTEAGLFQGPQGRCGCLNRQESSRVAGLRLTGTRRGSTRSECDHRLAPDRRALRFRLHGPRRWLGLLVAVALVSGGVVYTVEERHEDARARVRRRPRPRGAEPEPQTSRTAAAIAARRVAIDTILLRRAQAVQTGNEALFLADIDPANTKLRAAQKVLFANLVEIGFTELGYSQAEERFNPAVLASPRAYDVPGPGADALPDPEGRPDAR